MGEGVDMIEGFGVILWGMITGLVLGRLVGLLVFVWMAKRNSLLLKTENLIDTLGPYDGLVYQSERYKARAVHGFSAYRMHKVGRDLIVYPPSMETVFTWPNYMVDLGKRRKRQVAVLVNGFVREIGRGELPVEVRSFVDTFHWNKKSKPFFKRFYLAEAIERGDSKFGEGIFYGNSKPIKGGRDK